MEDFALSLSAHQLTSKKATYTQYLGTRSSAQVPVSLFRPVSTGSPPPELLDSGRGTHLLALEAGAALLEGRAVLTELAHGAGREEGRDNAQTISDNNELLPVTASTAWWNCTSLTFASLAECQDRGDNHQRDREKPHRLFTSSALYWC